VSLDVWLFRCSYTTSQIRRLDIQLDKFQIHEARSRQASFSQATVTEAPPSSLTGQNSRAAQLQAIVRSLSTTSSSRALLSRRRLRDLLVQVRRIQTHEVSVAGVGGDDTDLEWLVVAKAAVQTYGLILGSLFEQTIPLSDDIWYWNDVLGSYANTGLYTLQTSPLRFWKQSKEVFAEAKQRYASYSTIRESSEQATRYATENWHKFWSLVRESIKDRSLAQAQSRILSPFALCRSEARRKQNGLRKVREMNAAAIGLLVNEAMSFHVHQDDGISVKGTESPNLSKEEWMITTAKSVSLMESILRNVSGLEVSVTEFEDGVFASVDKDPEVVSTTSSANGSSARPDQLSERLVQILEDYLPGQESASQALVTDYGRPSRLVRYWIPGTILLISGSTLLRIFTSRKAEIRQWIQEFGTTVIDFWTNWVIDPIKKVIGTIRHDEGSEVAIMSKDSLKADQASLERMVVDFANDHQNETGARYTEQEIADIRAKVKEGDLTPVLKAYERDLKSPFMGTVRGDLIRTLLIQTQKTKVDVEVAIGGIDSLLKSQELLFGLVGLAPGIIISFAALRWLGSVFGSRKGLWRSKQQGQTIRLLR
jgi:nuclear control of ATPase protein 2